MHCSYNFQGASISTKDISAAFISIYQKKKSCFDMEEMDLTLSTKENIAKEKKKNIGIYCR
jgi:hypothetical protein